MITWHSLVGAGNFSIIALLKASSTPGITLQVGTELAIPTRLQYSKSNWRYIDLVLHPLTLLLLAFFCNTLLWAAVTGIGHPPDESAHFDYIRHLALTHSLPVYGQTHYIHRPDALSTHASWPPLYYLLGMPLQMALKDFSVTHQVLALRALSALLGGITVTLVYMLCRLLVPTRPPFALSVAALVAFNPMFTFLSAAINSDNLINLIYAGLLLLLAHGLRQQQLGRRWLIGLGALLGAGLIAKQTIVMGVLVSALVILFSAWRQRPRFFPTLVSYGFWVSSTALLISGWYFVRNWFLYGNPTGMVAFARPDIYRTHPYRAVGSLWEMIFATRGDFIPFLSGILHGFWGIFDHFEILMPARVYNILDLLLAGGLIGTALWALRTWRHRHQEIVRLRFALAVIGGLILAFAFAGIVSLSYIFDHQPQGRYLFSALAPVSLAIVGGWEQLAGLLRLRWLVAPLIVVLVLTVNVVGLVCALAPAHHNRYIAELLSRKQVETADSESYALDNRYVPKLPVGPEPALRPVFGASPIQASFLAEHAEIKGLEMLLNVPAGVHGPLIWRLGQQGTTDDSLLAIMRQPLAGPACYSISVSSRRFTAGQTYILKLDAPAITAQQPLLATVADDDAADNLSANDLRLQVVYPNFLNKQTLRRVDYLLRSAAPTSVRGTLQRLLYPLDSVLLLALAVIALMPLPPIRPWRIAIALPVLGLAVAALLPVPRAGAVFLPTYELAASPDLPPRLDTHPAPVYGGVHDVADCNVIGGWAWNANQPNTPVDVDIYDGVALVATISANIFRPDLVKAGIGNGYHGFIYAVDGLMKDGQPHSIQVTFAGTNIELSNTPKSITCSQVAAPTSVKLASPSDSPRARRPVNQAAFFVPIATFVTEGAMRAILDVRPTNTVAAVWDQVYKHFHKLLLRSANRADGVSGGGYCETHEIDAGGVLPSDDGDAALRLR